MTALDGSYVWAGHQKDQTVIKGLEFSVEPDILECKDKWALGSITMNKGSGDDGIPVSYFKS